jgi:hypothetical protein
MLKRPAPYRRLLPLVSGQRSGLDGFIPVPGPDQAAMTLATASYTFGTLTYDLQARE